MKIVVCVKQVIDPEAPPSSFRLDTATGKAEMRGVPPVIDTYSEFAVEAALKIKEATETSITILSLGVGLLREVIKKPLAMGADELILLEDQAYAGGDSWSTSRTLAVAIKKIGGYDLILCGREASDTNAGQTGSGIAEILGIPCVTLARKIDIIDGKSSVERVTAAGYDVIEVALPALITVSHEVGEPRYPTIRGIMAAKKKEPVVWKPADIGLEESHVGASGSRTRINTLYQPVYDAKCDFAEGDNPEEAAVNLASKLREARIL